MGRHDGYLYDLLKGQLDNFSKNKHKLPGINSDVRLQTFVKQLIDSIRRVQYVFIVSKKNISSKRADPNENCFDPIMAAVYMKQNGFVDEAFWLAFLSVNYGKNLKHHWKMVRDIYGKLGDSENWTWVNVTNDINGFKEWFEINHDLIGGAFGNHRKYESLRPDSPRSPGSVVESYVQWVGVENSHEILIQNCIEKVGDDPREMFDYLYKTMDYVVSFGRTSRFDYLTLLAKLGLVNIEPGLTYMRNSTGPVRGAKLLFYGSTTKSVSNSLLEEHLNELEQELSLQELGMQVLEDALCNWQKNPNKYNYFRG